MGLYSDYVFPHVLEWAMSRPPLREQRPLVVGLAAGDVLEIGFGTGLNLPFYNDRVRRLDVVDPARMLRQRVTQRLAESPLSVETHQLDAAQLPFDNASFDCVVSTWTLCSIDDVVAALVEVARVLRPGGRLLFIEHGRSEEPRVARWQDRLNPIQRRVGVGCNLNRPIDKLIEQAGLQLEQLDRFRLRDTPAILGEHYRGAATARG